MKNLHLFINLAHLSSNTPTLVKFLDEAIPAQAQELENLADQGQPLYRLKVHQQGQSIQYYAGLVEAKVGQLVGEDLDYQTVVVHDPLSKEFMVAVLPPDTTHYAVTTNAGTLPEDFTFQQALNAAYSRTFDPQVYDASIAPLGAQDDDMGDAFPYYYDEAKEAAIGQQYQAVFNEARTPQ